MDEGCAMQVVRVEEAAYELDEAALEALLGAAADVPVAVVSVAGACRGGKSFLLDYFIRYLTADEDARSDGSWLGAEDEPLRGFSWRGGSERDTTGLLLWSPPALVRLPDGQQVAVLLMDTQGAFDWRSSVRDCSTVFALSALLSSVQVYNISRDLRADDTHHLQLFSEYGKLAAAGGEAKPFQTLQILVRDWGCPYEYPYGADGGEQLLHNRFQNMGAELPELWQSIREAFDSVNCFLMPHPGLQALHETFDGRLAALSTEFKDTLLELAPSILSPETLVPKTVNGHTLTGRALCQYLRTYLEIFNSDQMPTPVSIFKATAQAGLLACAEDARAAYRRAMRFEAAMSRAALDEAHRRARDLALSSLANKKTLATAEQVAVCLDQLLQEFNDQLVTYDLLNEAKIKKGMAEAEAEYESRLRSVAEDLQALCLAPLEFDRVHQSALSGAVAKFNATRVAPDRSEDTDLDTLLQRVAERHRELRKRNEANNTAAVAAALEEYTTRMTEVCAPNAPALHPLELRKEDEDACAAAQTAFRARRNRPHTPGEDDPYTDVLRVELDHRHLNFVTTNQWKNNTIIEAAIAIYNTNMETSCSNSLWTPIQTIHVAVTFDEIETRCRDAAIEKFFASCRPQRRIRHEDVFLDQLNLTLDPRKTFYWEELQKDLGVVAASSVVAGAVAVGAGALAAVGAGALAAAGTAVAAAAGELAGGAGALAAAGTAVAAATGELAGGAGALAAAGTAVAAQLAGAAAAYLRFLR